MDDLLEKFRQGATKCLCAACSLLPGFTYSERYRHECEVRYVVAMKSHDDRAKYLKGVAEVRGKDAAERLRKDAWAMFQEREAA